MLTRLLTVLPLLLCPLLMLAACMWAMRHREAPPRQAGAAKQEPPTSERIARLERELAELRGRLPQAGAGEVPVDTATRPRPGSPNGTPMQPG